MTGIGKHLKNSLLGSLVLFASLSSYSQKPADTLRLDEVEVKASFSVDNMGFKRVRIDSTILIPRMDANLGTILSQYSTVFIKSYGNNNLATPSFRGTTAHHTIVEWNGITINSPMLGQVDLARLPVSQFEGVDILYGASSLSRTSGAFGGIIDLKTSPDWNNRIHLGVSQTVASFHNYTTVFHAFVGNRNIQSQTRLNFGTGENDFPFFNDFSGKKETLINGACTQYGMSEDIFLKFRDRHMLTYRIWFNYSERDIPPLNTNIDLDHTENQTDKTLRSLIEYKYIQRNLSLSITSALIDDYLRYVNDSLNAEHRYYSFINRIRVNYSGLGKMTLRPGLDMTNDWVHSDAYTDEKKRTVIGGFTELIYKPYPVFTVTLLARLELVDGALMPFIPALGLEYKPFKKINLSFSANLSRNYRFPSLNDLYWDTWGNPDLLPEISYAAEGGITWNRLSSSSSFFLEMELTGYYTLMKDLIVWTPSTTSSAIWTPENVSEVASRGIESGINSSLVFWKSNLDINITYAYCRSTYLKENNPNGSSVGNQLIYTPIHLLNGSLRYEWKGYYGSYIFNYTGRRYLGKDNTSYMPGYNLSNIFLGKNFQVKDFILSLQVEINNIFNLDYQSIANRPMPGRNFAFTIRGSFSNDSDQ